MQLSLFHCKGCRKSCNFLFLPEIFWKLRHMLWLQRQRVFVPIRMLLCCGGSHPPCGVVRKETVQQVQATS